MEQSFSSRLRRASRLTKSGAADGRAVARYGEERRMPEDVEELHGVRDDPDEIADCGSEPDPHAVACGIVIEALRRNGGPVPSAADTPNSGRGDNRILRRIARRSRNGIVKQL